MSVSIGGVVDLVARAVALTALGLSGVAALTHWAVRRKQLGPFTPWARLVRQASDPVLRPIERRLAGSGGNPQDATYWMLGIAVVGGFLLVVVTRWLLGLGYSLVALQSAPPRIWARVVVDWVFGLVMAAIIVRVIASWIGISRYRKWMRPVFVLSDWIVEPLRRRIPPWGIVDLSPFVAYLALVLARALVLSLFR